MTLEEIRQLKPNTRLHFGWGPIDAAGYFISLSPDEKVVKAKMAELGICATKLITESIRVFENLSVVETDEEWKDLTMGEIVF